MLNIYDIFESMRVYQLDLQYDRINESFEILESYSYIEEDLQILTEADEDAKPKSTNTFMDKTRNIFQFLNQQLEKIIEWISNIIKKFTNDFSVGREFLKMNDLNKAMQKLQQDGNGVMVKCHSRHNAIVNVQNEFKQINNKLQNEGKNYTMRNAGEKTSVEDLVKRFYRVETIEEMDEAVNKKFGMAEDQVNEVKLTSMNVMQIQNTLNNAVDVNKALEEAKRDIQDFYNKHINKIKRDGNSTNEKKINKSSGELKYFNDYMKVINANIRVYMKVVSAMFHEDFAIAKKIMSLASGKKIKKEKEEK